MRLSLDTETLPDAARLDIWTDVIWDLRSPMAVAAQHDGPFRASVVADDVGPLALRFIRTDPCLGTQRKETLAAARRERFNFTMTTEGAFDMSQFGLCRLAYPCSEFLLFTG